MPTKEKIRDGILKIIQGMPNLDNVLDVDSEQLEATNQILSYLRSNGLDYYLDATNKLPLDYSKPHWGLKW